MQWRTLGARVGLAVAIVAIGGGWIRDRDTVAAQSSITSQQFDHMPTREEIRRLIGELTGAEQPDTTASNWRRLSKDVGIVTRFDDRLGLRGRLFIRIEGFWYPVSMEATQNPAGIVPAR